MSVTQDSPPCSTLRRTATFQGLCKWSLCLSGLVGSLIDHTCSNHCHGVVGGLVDPLSYGHGVVWWVVWSTHWAPVMVWVVWSTHWAPVMVWWVVWSTHWAPVMVWWVVWSTHWASVMVWCGGWCGRPIELQSWCGGWWWVVWLTHWATVMVWWVVWSTHWARHGVVGGLIDHTWLWCGG